MRSKLLRILIPLFVATVVTAALVLRPAARPLHNQASVLILATALPQGAVLQQGEVRLERMTRTPALQGALASAAAAEGAVLTVPLAAGEVLRAEDLQPRQAAGLSYALPPGRLAVTLPVTVISGVGGSLQVGDSVDVLSSMPTSVGGAPVGRILVSGATVVALVTAAGGGPAIGGSGSGPYGGVTLACTPGEAAALQLAQSAGSISLALRPHGVSGTDSAVATEAHP